jgi:hypothetical protein
MYVRVVRLKSAIGFRFINVLLTPLVCYLFLSNTAACQLR